MPHCATVLKNALATVAFIDAGNICHLKKPKLLASKIATYMHILCTQLGILI